MTHGLRILALLAALILTGCMGTETTSGDNESEHEHLEIDSLHEYTHTHGTYFGADSPAAIAEMVIDGHFALLADEPYGEVIIVLTSTLEGPLEYRTALDGEWQTVEMEDAFDQRFHDIHLVLDEPSTELELRGLGEPRYLQVALLPKDAGLDGSHHHLHHDHDHVERRWAPLSNRWQIPDELRPAADNTMVTYDSAASCAGGLEPGTQRLRQYIDDHFSDILSIGGYNCRNIGGSSSLSLHAAGRALDVMLPTTANDQAIPEHGDPIANWLVENADYMGIQLVVWNQSIWSGGRSTDKFREYGGVHPHHDHVHLELNYQAANMDTPFFDDGMPAPHTRAVNEQGCTQQEVDDCGGFGCGCVEGECSGGYCDGMGCTTDEIYGCATQGCGCVDGQCSGGACEGAGCTQKQIDDCSEMGCDCIDGACAGGACGTQDFGTDARFHPRNAFRAADTRADEQGPMEAGSTRRFTFENAPSDAVGMTANITAIDPAESGYLTAYPCGTRPSTSNLNFRAGDTAANQVTASLSPAQELCVYTLAKTDLAIDINGWWKPGADGSQVASTTPTRVADTRDGALGGRLAGGDTAEVDLSTQTPGATTTAVSLNVTAIDPSADGYVTVYPCVAPQPEVSNLNFKSGQTRSNHATVAVGADRKICIHSDRADLDLAVDLTAVWRQDGAHRLHPRAPERVYDSRNDSAFAPGETRQIHPPQNGVVFGNLTATAANAAGYASVFPCDEGYRQTSNINYRTGRAEARDVVVDASRGGVCARTSTSAHLLLDIAGLQQ